MGLKFKMLQKLKWGNVFMDYYIMLFLLPCLLFASVLLYRFIKQIRRPRYIKDDSFMFMTNGGNLLKTACQKSIVVSYSYIDDVSFFCSHEE